MNATVTVRPETLAAALSTPFTGSDFAEERASFQAVTGYAARSITELEAWMDGPDALAAHVAANPLPAEADANPYGDIWDALTADVAPAKPTTTPKAMPAPITTPMAPRNLFAMPKADVQAAFAAHFGISITGVPTSYTRQKLIACIDGTMKPSGPNFKAAIKAAAEAKAGYAMPTTWNAAKMAGYVTGTQAPPKTTVAKTALVAKVLETFGHVPKNTTVAKLEKCLATGTAPRKQTNMNPWVKRTDGLTAARCLELIREAKAKGMEIKGYSKLKADDLRALVASLGLAE